MLSHAMCEKKFFLEGSGKLLTHYFQAKKGKRKIRIAFVGNNIYSDICAAYDFDKLLQETSVYAKWDVIAVVEEFIFLAHQN